MGTETAVMAFLDPPYNVKVKGHVGGRAALNIESLRAHQVK